MLRRRYTIEFPPLIVLNERGQEVTLRPAIIEVRSEPWVIKILDFWLLWAHEWPWLINKEIVAHRPFSWLCTGYTVFANWAAKFERIEGDD